ncbi:uncharacterized protein LOC111714666 [Eurytemora carolleeae]|uniref:uncharacterized protein LOC111714666 n=1 Tax=Eurytemora carolleeae TaxID=1294199 RepID=UPI000C76C0F0|nr:uncharacterized protein LOC111714666 [Eurytemora carolleeae]|eukprot:XP_023345580.1 uncharacterized protein LOC111714666 [Eurytemora affinis]
MILENKHGVQSLPCEVLQKIFELLQDSDLTAASLVSNYWRKVSERSIKKLCVLLIPEDILAEIISENKGCDWACIWYCWIRSKPGITNRFWRKCPKLISKSSDQDHEYPTQNLSSLGTSATYH